MRPVREITAEEENFRVEKSPILPGGVIKRDPIEPEPVGTIVLMAFRVTGYDPDCDGSLMARLAHININGDGGTTGWEPTNLGLRPGTALVVTTEDLHSFFNLAQKA